MSNVQLSYADIVGSRSYPEQIITPVQQRVLKQFFVLEQGQILRADHYNRFVEEFAINSAVIHA